MNKNNLIKKKINYNHTIHNTYNNLINHINNDHSIIVIIIIYNEKKKYN